MVTDVDERGLEVKYKDGRIERIESVTKIWAAGVQASALTATLSEQTGAPLDRAGRIGVNSDLTLPGHPEVFVVGDMIDLDHLPGVAQVAIQGAKYAAEAIDRRLAGKPPQKPFKYFDKGSMATISRFRAVAMIGNLRLTGFVAWLMWLVVHLFYVTGFKNRVTAVLHWAVSFLGRGRSERTATEQQIFGRLALGPARPRRRTTWSRRPPRRADRRGCSGAEDARRAELEAIAAEEARLTDAGERGVKVDAGACTSTSARGSLAPARRLTRRTTGWAGRVVLGDRLAGPLGQDEEPLGLDGDALGAGELAAGPGLVALDPLDPGLAAQVAERRALAVGQGQASRSCRACRRRLRPRRASGRAPGPAHRRARCPAVPRRPRPRWNSERTPRLVGGDHQRRGDRVAEPRPPRCPRPGCGRR